MPPERIPTPLCLEGLGRGRVVGRFDGGRLMTAGRVPLLREVDRRVPGDGASGRLLPVPRRRIEHRLEPVVAQRVPGLGGGLREPERPRSSAYG